MLFRRVVFVVASMVVILGLVSEIAFADAASDEPRFVDFMNHERYLAGLAPLSLDPSLSDIARNHSARMAPTNSIFHNSNLASEAPSGWAILGENVGRGGNIDDIHQAFMSSPSHRANVLGDFNKVGIGIVISGSYVYVTEVFWKTAASPVPALAASASKAKLAKKACRTRRSCRQVRSRGRRVAKRRARR